MTFTDTPQPAEDSIPEPSEEFRPGEATVGMIADPESAHAWIQSTVTNGVDP